MMIQFRAAALGCALVTMGMVPIAHAQTVDAAIVARFGECLSVEGGVLGEPERAALINLAPQLGASLGQPACESGDGAGCAAALAGMSCELLAGVWHTPVAAAVPEPAPWARQFVDALTGRILACLPDATGETQLAAQVAEYGLVLGASLRSALEAGGCRPDESQAAACASALATVDCADVSEGVTSGGMMPLPAGASDACGALFGCGRDLDAAMDEIDRERGALRLGEESP